VEHRLEVCPDPDEVARRAAELVREQCRRVLSGGSGFSWAVSGGRTPWAMFDDLAGGGLDWERVILFQVDERVAGSDDPDRNLVHLRASLGDAPARVVPMAVEDEDLDRAAARYAAELPERFDLVHLGLGPDGHTASLVPGDPVLEVTDRLVAPTALPYQGHRRLTLTYPALARADRLLWLVTGEEKRDPLARLLAGDRSIPAGRVTAAESIVLADAAAAG
jgi:6-phosphogluconolactonase